MLSPVPPHNSEWSAGSSRISTGIAGSPFSTALRPAQSSTPSAKPLASKTEIVADMISGPMPSPRKIAMRLLLTRDN